MLLDAFKLALRGLTDKLGLLLAQSLLNGDTVGSVRLTALRVVVELELTGCCADLVLSSFLQKVLILLLLLLLLGLSAFGIDWVGGWLSVSQGFADCCGGVLEEVISFGVVC
jgi:hypothetical protein